MGPLERDASRDGRDIPWRVVGPVCESSDDFGVFELPENAPAYVALLDAGAYGFTMASQYNGRSIPSEVFLEDGRIAGLSAATKTHDWIENRLRAGA